MEGTVIMILLDAIFNMITAIKLNAVKNGNNLFL